MLHAVGVSEMKETNWTLCWPFVTSRLSQRSNLSVKWREAIEHSTPIWFCPKSRPALGDRFYSERHIKNTGFQITGFNCFMQTPRTRKAEKQKPRETLPKRLYKSVQNLSTHMLHCSGMEPCTLRLSVCVILCHRVNTLLYLQMRTDSAPNLT